MTAWRPASGPQVARRRAAMLRRVRGHFDSQSVLEIDTPALSPFAVSDPQIESFCIHDSAAGGRPLYLQTSPEFCMKRLLAAGYPDIYSICRVFRDGETGAKHQPEFTLVEWYRLGMGLQDIVDDTLRLIGAVLGDAESAREAHIVDYGDAVASATGIDVATADIGDLAAAVGADDRLRAAIGNDRNAWLDLLLTTHVIPAFADDRLTVLRHYPASQAALARRCPDDPAVADRFEVFLGSIELANGYVELTDAVEQSRRMAADNKARKRLGRPVRPVDESLLDALTSGLPQCAGVALGLERLQMCIENTDDIRNVITFAFDSGRSK